MKIAVLSYRYPIEISPTVIGILNLLIDEHIDTTLLIDKFTFNKGFNLPGLTINKLLPHWIDGLSDLIFKFRKKTRNRLLFRLIRKIGVVITIVEKIVIQFVLKRHPYDFDRAFAIEFPSLYMLYKTGFDLSLVTYFSLESEQLIREYGTVGKKLLSKCGNCVIQSKERAQDLNRILETDIKFNFLPVSLKPVEPKLVNRLRQREKVKIIYSGFFSEWSYLREFLSCFEESDMIDSSQLLIQGHAHGTENYFDELLQRYSKQKNIQISNQYIDYDEYIGILNSYDVGIALYKTNNSTPNWRNLLFSSGKIAHYLWSGLAILTNIKHKFTEKPPFIFVSRVTCREIEEGLKKYMNNRIVYHKSAVSFAEEHYNLYSYMRSILEEIEKN